jgi:membrane fusion protein, multidrug efflux system
MINNNIQLITFLLLLAACSGNGGQSNVTTDTATEVPDTVPVFVLAPDTLKKTVELPGELIPYEQADLYAKVQGFVRSMKADIGDHVKKGQTLAIIEAPEVNTRFSEAEAALQAAKAKWAGSLNVYTALPGRRRLVL